MKNPKYKVALYENGKRIKTFAYFRTYPESLDYYNQKIDNNQVFFPKEVNWLGRRLDYEIVILGKKGKKLTTVKDDLGIKTEIVMAPGAQFFIKNLNPYYIEEKFKYWNKNEMITFKDLIKRVVMHNLNTKSVYCFNNKVLIIDDIKDNYYLFIVKCEYDANRLVDTIRRFCQVNRTAHIFFFYENFDTRELYPKIIDKLGIKRTELWKVSTH